MSTYAYSFLTLLRLANYNANSDVSKQRARTARQDLVEEKKRDTKELLSAGSGSVTVVATQCKSFFVDVVEVAAVVQS